MGLSDGVVKVKIEIAEKYYYENISALCGVTISGEKELISLILSLTEEKNEYERLRMLFIGAAEGLRCCDATVV